MNRFAVFVILNFTCSYETNFILGTFLDFYSFLSPLGGLKGKPQLCGWWAVGIVVYHEEEL